MLVVIEGIDGVGKSSVISELSTGKYDIGSLKFKSWGSFPNRGKSDSLFLNSIRNKINQFLKMEEPTEYDIIRMSAYAMIDQIHAQEDLDRASEDSDIWLVDRYIATGIAYGAVAWKDNPSVVDTMSIFRSSLVHPWLDVLITGDKEFITTNLGRRIKHGNLDGVSNYDRRADILMDIQDVFVDLYENGIPYGRFGEYTGNTAMVTNGTMFAPNISDVAKDIANIVENLL